MELHKYGKIWAESEGEGKGCTFFVQLPLHSHHYEVPVESTRMEHPPTRIDTQPIISPQPIPLATIVEDTWKPVVLVVDDSAMNRKVHKSKVLSPPLPPLASLSFRMSLYFALTHQYSLCTHNLSPSICQMLVRMLISKGFACHEAEDGMEALSEISRWCRHTSKSGNDGPSRNPSRQPSPFLSAPPRFSLIQMNSPPVHQENSQMQYHFAIDAVLIDSNMPRMNGPEAIVEMRKLGYRGPIIGVSGGDEKTLKEFLDAGASNVMQKPVHSDNLMNMLLSGLQLVVQEATISRHHESSFLDASENVWNEHIQRLQQFIEVINAI